MTQESVTVEVVIEVLMRVEQAVVVVGLRVTDLVVISAERRLATLWLNSSFAKIRVTI